MKRIIRYALFIALITVAPNWVSAQTTDILGGIAGALINAAANASRNTAPPAPAQPAKQSPRPVRRQTPSSTQVAKPRASKTRSSATAATSDVDANPARSFEGTWLATRSKVS